MILAGIISALTVSCRDHNDLYQEPPTEGPKEFNDFDYATEQEVTLQISYKNMGGIETSVDFEVYDQMPVEETEYTFVKKEGIEPIYADRTENDGTFSKKLSLPSYTKTLYIYTHAFYARTLLTADVENGTAIATDEVKDEGRAVARESRAGGNYCFPVKYEGWHEFLGNYDSEKGYINYVYKDNDLTYTWLEASYLYRIQSNVINSKKTCPQEYRSSTDMYINEEAEIAVTLLGGNTCWNSSMGYYFYKEGEAPTSLKDANVILIFPNTQDGKWGNGYYQAQQTQGVNRGTTVQLKYYPHIANGGSQEGATSIFPAGYRIGFVLATNGWTGRISGFNQDKFYRAATSQGLSINDNGQKYDQPRTAVYRYKDAKWDINAVIFSFEDYCSDENFSDVVFTLKTNPVDAITDIPEVSDDKNTVKTLKGVYAFEDLWPNKGDYDMNDVLIVSRYEKAYNDDGICEESLIFKTLENKATNQNGLGLTLVNSKSNPEITLTINGQKTDFKQEGDVFLLTDNVKKYMGQEYKLTLKYEKPSKKEEATSKPFIWKKSDNGNWEVHIAQEEPTPLVDKYYFNKGDDTSNKGIYYVREGNYPFAFFLSGATEANISKLLDPANESKPISDLYSGYAPWAESKGKTNQDWYNK